MSRSPLHYLHSLTAPHVDTPAMLLGRVIHARLLGGPRIEVFEGERRGKAWAEFKLGVGEGVEIITEKEDRIARGVVDAVLRNADAVRMLEGEHEVEIPWTFNDRACMSHIDVIGSQWITELKTATTVEPFRFVHHAIGMGYHAQLSFYEHACLPMPHLGIVAVETKPPFAVQCYELTRNAIEAGHKLWRSWFEMLQVCEASNIWPAYSQTVLPFDVDAAPEYVWPSEGGDSDQ